MSDFRQGSAKQLPASVLGHKINTDFPVVLLRSAHSPVWHQASFRSFGLASMALQTSLVLQMCLTGIQVSQQVSYICLPSAFVIASPWAAWCVQDERIKA